MREILIAPSILSASFTYLENELDEVFKAGAKVLHYDVMDGHFVNNISFGSHILSTINTKHNLINDVHLMVTDPNKYIESFVKAKADSITVHYESFSTKIDLINTINLIKSYGVKVGVAIKPKTKIDVLFNFIKDINLVLIMSVEPGFGGQKFITESYKKIEDLQAFRKKKNLKFLIEVDGGINDSNSHKLINLGCDILVCGSYIFNAANKEEAISKLKE